MVRCFDKSHDITCGQWLCKAAVQSGSEKSGRGHGNGVARWGRPWKGRAVAVQRSGRSRGGHCAAVPGNSHMAQFILRNISYKS
jgi:hypothetical protein